MIRDIIPTQNVTWDDIRDTLNFHGGSVDNNVSSAFKETAKVNPWSKYKPVPYREAFTESSPNWYMGDNWFCGLKFSTSDYLNDYKNNTAFKWDNPKGGELSPYRLGDFRRYNAKATPFIKSRIKKGTQLKFNYQEQKDFTIIVEFRPSSLDEITLKDLDTALHNKSDSIYLCMDVYNDNPLEGLASFDRTIKAEKPLMQGGTSIRIAISEGDIGTSRYGVFYLKEDSYPIIMPIPFDNDNYPVFSYRVTNDFLVSALINAIANIESGSWFDLTGQVSSGNSFITTGLQSIQLKIEVKNDSTTRTINLRSDVNFRIKVTGKSTDGTQSITKYITDFSIAAEGGGDTILKPGETKNIIFIEGSNVLYDFIFGTYDARLINFVLEGRAGATGDIGWQGITTRSVFMKSM